MTNYYIGLGSNQQHPEHQLLQALQAIKQLPDSRLLAHSGFYQSAPMGPQDQPDYINAVAAVASTLAPFALLQQLQHIEQQQGRVRDRRWGERTLDLDILLSDAIVLRHPRLNIPHIGLTERDFALLPLLEIAPQARLPNGKALQAFTSTVPDYQLNMLISAAEIAQRLQESQ
ncbi:2-amino-4-hydroxy-6-hydroxymethyldihydropteridine diphosphokinase [Idiomarina tyrosinivorans]|uniref:2-amino-4-hydroxy-6-hydroxymethyldihydropteridine pyrophosphokinase n=1 Tax=Idiomarina tyrosinivorans TaxID=1445662 RepID=A0A432ZRZ0_9GAMM|nr:2-amino-4-hydroxy-6-hydroxymethyldihydropteridine diphosphokinase [Idiomarina tyrosinivorans]RUO80667.1 2-amino-4-hydroxy-6-hydroxymethyldihydropteridine diphosphokinase [Idiomarina tyrosinivorans]